MATTPRKTPTKKSASASATKSATAKKPRKTTKASKPPPAATAEVKRATTAASRTKGAAAKPATAKASKPAAKPAVTPTIVSEKPVVAAADLRKSDFIDKIVLRTGMKKKDVKPVIEATMKLLGDALEEGREVNFPELGKVKVNREKELAGAKVIICKVRRSKKGLEGGAAPLAKPAE